MRNSFFFTLLFPDFYCLGRSTFLYSPYTQFFWTPEIPPFSPLVLSCLCGTFVANYHSGDHFHISEMVGFDINYVLFTELRNKEVGKSPDDSRCTASEKVNSSYTPITHEGCHRVLLTASLCMVLAASRIEKVSLQFTKPCMFSAHHLAVALSQHWKRATPASVLDKLLNSTVFKTCFSLEWYFALEGMWWSQGHSSENHPEAFSLKPLTPAPVLLL